MFFGKGKSKRVLTLALIQGNRPAIEKSVAVRDKVVIGSHPKNTFVVTHSGLPEKFVVLKPDGERYLLHFFPSTKGKIAVNESSMTLATLQQKGVVENKNGVCSVSISDKTRGKLVFGDCRLLFRFDEAI